MLGDICSIIAIGLHFSYHTTRECLVPRDCRLYKILVFTSFIGSQHHKKYINYCLHRDGIKESLVERRRGLVSLPPKKVGIFAAGRSHGGA